MKHRLALIGFGNVGQGLVSILVEKKEALKRDHGFEFDIVAVCDTLKGSVRNGRGLDGGKLLDLAGSSLDAYPGGTKGEDAATIIAASNATVLVEASYTDLTTGEPATSYIKTALATGKHVVTTNKGPLALHYAELAKLARAKKLQLRFEGTVMSGTPMISFGMQCLAGCEIREIRGIFNGTTNFILSEMEQGQAYAEALSKAQELGYAEADPTGDVEGFDTMGKVLILSNVFMGGVLKRDEIQRQGITGLTPKDITKAQAEGKRWKLIGSVRREGDRVVGSVGPQALPLANPLTSVMGATNAAQFATDLMGEVTVVGAGAGRRETGFAILADLLAIHRTIG